MSATFAEFGNALHSGRRSLPIVRRRRTWYLISIAVLVVLAALGLVRGPNLGIEFTGGSEFQIAGVADTDQTRAREIVREHVPGNEPNVTVLGQNTMRVQTEELDSGETAALAEELAAAYQVDTSAVSTSFVGPVWSTDITRTMVQAVLVFLVLVAATMALYFRNLKASAAAMVALLHDMLLTVAVYLVIGFEITPGTVIGFLTIMGYSLYDTIVVFDKVRENTAGLTQQTRATYAERVERAANQTLVRSINTSVVALLPVGSILVIGAFILGAGTLKDISLALFVGILTGTYSSIALAPGLIVDLRRGEKEIRAHSRRVHELRREGAGTPAPAAPADDGATAGDVSDPDEDEPEQDEATAAPDTEIDAADDEDDEDGTGAAAAGTRAAPDRPRQQPRRTSRRRRTASRRGHR